MEEGGPATPVIALLERVWRMHPEVSAADVLACALEAQVRHLAQLPARGRWMMRFLRDLPTSVAADAAADGPRPAMVEDDVVCALALRCSSHGMSGDAVHEDAAAICRAALRHLPPGLVCRISLRAYERIRGNDGAMGEES
jgi:hypothetical protein